MNGRSLVISALAILVLGGQFASSQTGTWSEPANPQKVDFTTGEQRWIRGADDALLLEQRLEFRMVKHRTVEVQAQLPIGAQFAAEQQNRVALVDIKNVRVEQGRGKAEVVLRIEPLSREAIAERARADLGKLWDPVFRKHMQDAERMKIERLREQLLKKFSEDQLREWVADVIRKENAEKDDQQQRVRKRVLSEIYASDRTLQELVPKLRQRLDELASRHPTWVTTKDRSRWQRSADHTLRDDCLDLLECEQIEKYLPRWGLDVDAKSSGSKAKLRGRMAALDLVLSGKMAENPEESAAAFRSLGPEMSKKLADILTVKLSCRVQFEVDPQDPNAQWYHGTRVACYAKGASSIRLEGRLDPAHHDSVDWWILEGFAQGTVQVTPDKSSTFRADALMIGDDVTALRVLAVGDRAAAYGVELRVPGRTGELKLVIHESPDRVGTKFPY